MQMDGSFWQMDYSPLGKDFKWQPASLSRFENQGQGAEILRKIF